jgi:SpoU rRNA methylase family enzyme
VKNGEKETGEIMTKAELEEINERLNLEIIRLRKECAEKDALVQQQSEQLERLSVLFEGLNEQVTRYEKYLSEVSDYMSKKEREEEDDE